MTFFVGEAIRFSISNTPDFTRGMLGLSVAPYPDVLGIDFERSNLYAYYYLLLVLTAAIMGFMWWLVKSRYGLAFEALREAQLATQSLGPNTPKHKLSNFPIPRLLPAAMGPFPAPYPAILSPSPASLGV